MRDTLIFGQAYQGGSPLDPTAAVAALPDDAEICGCNGVCKGAIVSAIAKNGLTSLDEVRARTKASASCGQCTSKVEAIIASALGGGYKGSARKPMCKCTDLTHEEVRGLIVEKHLRLDAGGDAGTRLEDLLRLSVLPPGAELLSALRLPQNLSRRRAIALRQRARARQHSKGRHFLRRAAHVGRLTTPAELRAIADVAEDFKIPTVKMTGGQRIDLLGVRKEDLPAVWARLNAAGMVSGHAYAKGLRTVKTCVGKEWCRFGTQDSTGLGVKLERLLCGSWTPAKMKLAVSGCPRNCAEATVKDIGVICVDSGYDIHIAGAAGLHVRATDFLGHVETEEEALEHVAAAMQLYREEAAYLDRLYKWVEKTGLERVRQVIMEDHTARKALFERFLVSQHAVRKDPWAERVAGLGAQEFSPLAIVAPIARIAAE